ncbi:DUF523 domain-containing protein [Clostridium paridis]|uniref:DUF523 domain-containing protein n=1 Tax=Clostridium paridis TaxID=2803863 RepID=A0A937FGM4_9CLOT|nr:DUF523 domain-containing protein [Clostridium paridis]MBL4931071.1 DUF523 domain-containing protein [Clostridium paridis]
MIIVSACLLGVNCKYNGQNNEVNDILKFIDKDEIVLVCPEQLGGLTTPRPPAEIDELGNVITKNGNDVTKEFTKGAEETLKIAKLYNVNAAILKKNSPSCGFGEIYSGTFQGVKKSGNGITAELLNKNNIKVYNEENFKGLLSESTK